MKKFKAPGTFFICFLLLLNIIWVSCSSSKEGIRAINFKDNLDSVFDPQSYALDEGRYLYYYKDYTVFFLDQQILDYGIMTPDSNNVFTGPEIKRRLAFKYFVFKRNSEIGLELDSLNIKIRKKVEKDSIFKKYITNEMNFHTNKNFTVVHTEILPNNILFQKYASNDIRRPYWYSDSIYCYYSKKLNGIEYSYSKPLDSLMGMKLFKTEVIFDSLYKTNLVQNGLPRVLRHEMKEIKVKDPALIKSLCQRYEREINNK